MHTNNSDKNHLKTRSLVALLFLLVLVVGMSASLAHAEPTPRLTMSARIRQGNQLYLMVGIEQLPHSMHSIQFQVQAWFSPNDTIIPLSPIYSGSAVVQVKGDKASKNFIAPYKGRGDYFVQTLAINPQDNSVLANLQADPFNNVSFITTLSSDGTTLILTVSISQLKGDVKTVNFVVNAAYAAPGATDFTPFYSGGGSAQVCKWERSCSSQGVYQGYYMSGGTASLTLKVPYQGAGSYYFEVYAYNAANGKLLGDAAGDPCSDGGREGTGG